MSAAARKTPAIPCALGIRVHSGWGAAIVVSRGKGSVEVVERRRIEIISPRAVGAAQPYHFAVKLAIEAAERHIAGCRDQSTRLAREALDEIIKALSARQYYLQGAVILLGSGHSLPELRKILAAHPLIHTAEGEFFRQAFRRACQQLRIPVVGIRERDLGQQSATVFGRTADEVKKRIDALGKSLGPPWTRDQKTAALAAAIALAR
jgi:hypothetical protein